MNGYMVELYQRAAAEIHACCRDQFVYHGGRWWVRVQGEDGTWIWTRNQARERLSAVVAAYGVAMDDRVSTALLKRNLTAPWGRTHVISAATDLFTRADGLPCPVPGPQEQLEPFQAPVLPPAPAIPGGTVPELPAPEAGM